MSTRIDIDKPRWCQSSFLGRLKHFANITDPRLILVPRRELESAKDLIDKYRQGKEPAGTTEEQLYRAQKLYQSAFHPDTGELQNFMGRMSFQVPGGTVLIAAMITFYKTNTAVVFWQWANQSFNALVNYTNRNAKSPVTPQVIAFSYCTATSAAVVTALGLKRVLAKRGGTLLQRLVPLAAVYAAQCVNIPLMRQNEIKHGLVLTDEKGVERGKSSLAALKAIGLVVLCRNVLATPSMVMTPVLMELLEKQRWFRKNRSYLNTIFQVFFSAAFLLPMVPTACALYPQKNYITAAVLEKYEPKAFKSIQSTGSVPQRLFFNKGL